MVLMVHGALQGVSNLRCVLPAGDHTAAGGVRLDYERLLGRKSPHS